MTTMLAQINFRSGNFYLTEIDNIHTPETLAQRMCQGGFVICREYRWGAQRTIVVNLKDVSSIVLKADDSEATK